MLLLYIHTPADHGDGRRPHADADELHDVRVGQRSRGLRFGDEHFDHILRPVRSW